MSQPQLEQEQQHQLQQHQQQQSPQEVYRIVYLHAGKNKGTKDLKQDAYHITLFRDTLNLRFANGYDAEHAANDVSTMETIESLPRGQILGIMMITESFWFEKAKHRHSDEWMLGPFVYKIGEAVTLDQGIAVDGKLGKWTPSKEVHAQIMQQPTIQQKMQEWHQRYGSKLYIGEEGIPCAMTIHQPFVEAILRGVKKYENRKRPMFPLHPKIKPSPPSPDMTQCRFCPDDDQHDVEMMMINTDNGMHYHSPKKLKCTYWAHVKDDKKDKTGTNERKIRKHRASKSRRVSAASLVSQTSTQQHETTVVREFDVFEYGIEYNTRSKAKGDEQENSAIALLHSGANQGRKRKHSERQEEQVMEEAVTSPPTKKQKVSKKERKNKKAKRASSRQAMEEEEEDTYDEQQWKDMIQEYEIGEDGAPPLRMCAHGTLMEPVPHDENEPHSCDICADGKPMNWDMFYVCHCNQQDTDWCYDHTRPVEFGAAKSWKKLCDRLRKLDAEQVAAIKGKYKRLLKELRKDEKKRVHKTKRKSQCEVEVVGVEHDDECEVVEVSPGRKLRKKKKKKKRKKEIGAGEDEPVILEPNAPSISTSNGHGNVHSEVAINLPFGAAPLPPFNAGVPLGINPFSAKIDALCKRMPPIEIRREQLDVNIINQSINELVKSKQSNAKQQNPAPAKTDVPKFDFSQFPQNLAPTTAANISARPSALFAAGTLSNGSASHTNTSQKPPSNENATQPQPLQPPFGASLGQIINAPLYKTAPSMMVPLNHSHTDNSLEHSDSNNHNVNDMMMHIPVPTQTSTQPPLAGMNQTPASSASSPFAATPDIIHKNQSTSNSVQSLDRIQTLISAANHVESSQPQQQQNHSINATISPQAFTHSFPVQFVAPSKLNHDQMMEHHQDPHAAINATQTPQHTVVHSNTHENAPDLNHNHSNNSNSHHTMSTQKASMWGTATWDSSASTSQHTTTSNTGAHSPKSAQKANHHTHPDIAGDNAESNESSNNHNGNDKNHKQAAHGATLPLPPHGAPVHAPYMYPAFQPIQLHPISGPNGTHMACYPIYHPHYGYLMPHYPHVQQPPQPPITNKPVAVQR